MLSFTISAQAHLYSMQLLKSRKDSPRDKPGNLLHLAIPRIFDDPEADEQTALHIELIVLLIQMGASPNEKLDLNSAQPVSAWQLALVGAWHRCLTRPLQANNFDFKLLAALVEHGADPDSLITLESEKCKALEIFADLCSHITEANPLLATLRERRKRQQRVRELGRSPEDEQSAFEANLAVWAGIGRSIFDSFRGRSGYPLPDRTHGTHLPAGHPSNPLDSFDDYVVKIQGLDAVTDGEEKRTKKKHSLRRLWRSSKG